jgi:hypothetical protein
MFTTTINNNIHNQCSSQNNQLQAEGTVNTTSVNLVLANSLIHSKILVTTYSESASLKSPIYNYDQGARSFVTTCLYMHTVNSLAIL